MFAKLFDETEIGQVLVKLDDGEESKPEVRVYFQPDGLGVCSTALCWDDSDDGWYQAGEAFKNTDEVAAVLMAKRVLAMIDDAE